MQKSCGQGEQRLERETTLVRGSDSWASISLLKDLISILLAMGQICISGSCTNVDKKTGLRLLGGHSLPEESKPTTNRTRWRGPMAVTASLGCLTM